MESLANPEALAKFKNYVIRDYKTAAVGSPETSERFGQMCATPHKEAIRDDGTARRWELNLLPHFRLPGSI